MGESRIPCSNCHRWDRGRLQYAYMTTFEDKVRTSWRVRLCPVCYAAWVPDFCSLADRQLENGNWVSPEMRV